MSILGAMQHHQLRVMRLVDHASREHGGREIVSAWADGTISRTNWHGVAQDARRMAKALTKLGIETALIRRAVDTNAKYLVVPGEFLAVDAAPAMMLRGVHSYSAVERSYAVSRGGQGIVGHVSADDKGLDGVELALEVLRPHGKVSIIL